ncbi:hypothetical protein [Maribacter sp. ACAM166]|uniref:hypothetical protein n=1 Tax=Maribacter sp. ACAM166 TaxID=2508996 RepID=UPI0010FDDAAE|nr:hypothetical protein [Maribacter sp. ACAM166]TLP79808.1 hypothetical protein ES765_10040 [Maribacter sp. ACAM166]
MKKKINLILLLVVHFTFLQMNAQDVATSQMNNDGLVPHQEQVYVHANSTLVFVGEYLYYTMYCLKDTTGQLSDVSKIAYLKLVNENKEVVLNQKIKLTNGIGDSNFFIPSSIPSGNYKVIAYTQWMLNNGKNYFYSNDITVLNPYTNDQAVFRIKDKNDSVGSTSKLVTNGSNTSLDNMPLRLELNETTYATRQPISLQIAATTLEGLGNYSVSVRKVDEMETQITTSALDYKSVYPKKGKIKKLLLPELRGELLIGELTATNDIGNNQNKVVAASFPGEDYLFKLATTDSKGQFYINVAEDYTANEVYVQVINDGDEEYEIKLKPEKDLDFADLKFEIFKLDRKMESLIKERSIYNQIENAYYSSKPDTILIGKPNSRFYGKGTMNYVLDEYTRFPSIRETFVEVVEHVWIQQNKEGKTEFHVRPIAPYIESGKLPLVFVDGLLVIEHERLINLSSVQVESINISRNQHFYGTKSFQGVVDVTTIKSNFYENYYTDNMLSHKLFKPNESKNYYHQSYDGALSEEYKRLPDFRYQLIWFPNFQMTAKEGNIEFYSSDITGEYEVSLEGFTKTGIPVSLRKNFWVK